MQELPYEIQSIINNLIGAIDLIPTHNLQPETVETINDTLMRADEIKEKYNF